MQLHDLLAAIDVLEVINDKPIDVSAVTHDSRNVASGSMFCCVPGAQFDGHDFAASAVDGGAVALLVERDLAAPVPQARVASVRTAIGPVAARVCGDPSRAMTVVGITGTNGKTTTSHMIESIVAAAGLTPGVLGTLGLRFAGRVQAVSLTTPEAPDLQRALAALRDAGTDVVAMEVSSHALAEHRVDGTRFAAVCFTNLSHDHLDYHRTIADYGAAKARLFTPEFSDRAAINVGDRFGGALAVDVQKLGLEVIRYSAAPIGGASDQSMERVSVWASDLVVASDGTRFRLHIRDESAAAHLPLAGRFNVANALAAAATATALDHDLTTIVRGLERTATVPGRFEAVGDHPSVAVIVDYAHTPDGVATVLSAAREFTAGRIIAVFGCGGGRDSAKRNPMGAAAGAGADVVVLTSDNPRSESPESIAQAVAVGLRAVGAEFSIELDRRLAIRSALAAAEAGDTVMILGKGAEAGQLIGADRVPFDDRVVAREEMDARWN